MRRDDLRAYRETACCSQCVRERRAIAELHTRPVEDAEVLDAIGRAAALQHWLTDPCETCSGEGAHPQWGDEHMTEPWIDCLTCDGRGWVPKDVPPPPDEPVTLRGTAMLVPLDWLEDGDG